MLHVPAQSIATAEQKPEERQLVILDTDIGDDIDDAFALALLLRSPEVKLLGVTTAFGDTELRARLVDRYLQAVGRTEIPVTAGAQTPHSNVFTQEAYAEQAREREHPGSIKFLLDQIRAHPGQITLIAIGPLTNVQVAIQRDPATFRQLKRVVMMGGSVYRGYDSGDPKQINQSPSPEWNIRCDPAGAQALLASGVPVFMMPLDSTQIRLTQVSWHHPFARIAAHRSIDIALSPVDRRRRMEDAHSVRSGGSRPTPSVLNFVPLNRCIWTLTRRDSRGPVRETPMPRSASSPMKTGFREFLLSGF